MVRPRAWLYDARLDDGGSSLWSLHYSKSGKERRVGGLAQFLPKSLWTFVLFVYYVPGTILGTTGMVQGRENTLRS